MSEPIAVWAPSAASVALQLRDGSMAMVPDAASGWWHGPTLAPDTDYRFVVDGTALSDPRSPRLPEGPEGWSRTVDHTAFSWTDDAWTGRDIAGGVVYELHVGTFSQAGTFAAAIEHLDHLVALGVAAVEIMPVATFPGRRGWGYDGVGLFAPLEHYGGPAGLARLVDACHARGIAVLIDVVYNHLGPVGNVLGRFGPYFTDRYHTPWGAAVDYDGPDSAEVRRFVIDNALSWIVDYHADGLRLDAVHALHDASPTHIVAELAAVVRAAGERLGRRVWLVGESDLDDPALVCRADESSEGGANTSGREWGLDAVWSDDFHHALHVTLTGEQDGYYGDYSGMADLATALADVYVYSGQYCPSRGEPHGHPAGSTDRARFIGFSQNHDQVGNRALGERLCHLVSFERAQIAAVLTLTAPFTPMLLQGEEWAAGTPFQYFTDFADPAIGQAMRDGRRREFAQFGWRPDDVPDPQDPATFVRSRLDWSELDLPPHAAMLAWYRALIDLRAKVADLRDGDPAATFVTHGDEHGDAADAAQGGWLVVQRGSVTVVVNLGPATVIPIAPGTIVLTNDPEAEIGRGGVHVGRDRVTIIQHHPGRDPLESPT